MSGANTKVASVLMALTYLAGGVGVAIGFGTVTGPDASLTWAALLSVGAAGLLSFLRHSVFHRSDALRMGWDSGRRNNFQIEVGIANLAFALLAILAVVLHWGLVAESAAILVFGLYLGGATILMLSSPRDAQARPWRAILAIGVFAAMLLAVGFMGMEAGHKDGYPGAADTGNEETRVPAL